jgi:transketolase
MFRQFDSQSSKSRCNQYRLKILAISQRVTALHMAAAFSCLEMVEVLYHYILRPEDTFLLSKGHGCLIQYTILEELGVLQKKDIDEYGTKEGLLGAHPDYGIPGIAAATGSLGHGLGMAVGMAYANKIQNKSGIIYVVISDGELQEGSTWEAIMMASNLALNNLVVCIDFNDFTSLGALSNGHPAVFPVAEKWIMFGWQAETIDGHDSQAIYSALIKSRTGPSVIVGKTVKGKGVSFMESVPIWHYRSPNTEEYEKAVYELSEKFS